jgi:hypothetical protein
MIIEVKGQVHRLFFEHEDVPRYRRYKGVAPITDVTHRTLCRLDKVVGTDSDGKRIWQPVAEGVVYLNHADKFSKAKGCGHAFTKLLESLRGTPTSTTGYNAGDRAEIAKQFLASRPRRKTIKDYKRENAQLKAELAKFSVVAQSACAGDTY